MDERFDRVGQWAVMVVLALGLCLVPGSVVANSTDAVETTAGDLEDHEATSHDPDEMTAQSHDPEDLVVESETMEGREAEAESPASMVVEAGRMEGREATSTSLTDLPEAKPDRGFREIDAPGQAEWGPTTDPEVIVARRNLVRAEKRAKAARTAYGDAQERNYPRGEARIRIVEERDAAMQALEEAKRALEAVE